jgi:hypothetical protein
LLGLSFSVLDLNFSNPTALTVVACLIILCPHRGSNIGLNFSLLDLGRVLITTFPYRGRLLGLNFSLLDLGGILGNGLVTDLICDQRAATGVTTNTGRNLSRTDREIGVAWG